MVRVESATETCQSMSRIGAAAIVSIFVSLDALGDVSAKRQFAAVDDVGLALFEYAGTGQPGGASKYSADGQYFAVVTERGRLDLGAPEDTIWLFRTEDLQRYVQHPEQGTAPSALPLVQLATDKDGPLVEGVRWLPDSSG